LKNVVGRQEGAQRPNCPKLNPTTAIGSVRKRDQRQRGKFLALRAARLSNNQTAAERADIALSASQTWRFFVWL
jgi:hypothetical protein